MFSFQSGVESWEATVCGHFTQSLRHGCKSLIKECAARKVTLITVLLSCSKTLYLFPLPSTAHRAKSWRAQERYLSTLLWICIILCCRVFIQEPRLEPKPCGPCIIMSFFSQLSHTFIWKPRWTHWKITRFSFFGSFSVIWGPSVVLFIS